VLSCSSTLFELVESNLSNTASKLMSATWERVESSSSSTSRVRDIEICWTNRQANLDIGSKISRLHCRENAFDEEGVSSCSTMIGESNSKRGIRCGLDGNENVTLKYPIIAAFYYTPVELSSSSEEYDRKLCGIIAHTYI